jgi:hypothetical protein
MAHAVLSTLISDHPVTVPQNGGHVSGTVASLDETRRDALVEALGTPAGLAAWTSDDMDWIEEQMRGGSS